MRKSINARVVGHRLFVPDPKNAPKVELVKIAIEFAPLNEAATVKNSAGTLIAPREALEHFAIGTYLRVSIEDTQQVLPLARAQHKAKKVRERTENPELH